jgi:hypothetical protein
MRTSGKLPKVRLDTSVAVGCRKTFFKSRRAPLASLISPGFVRSATSARDGLAASTSIFTDSILPTGRETFAYHVWQRARQNFVYIEIPPITNRNRPRPNPFIEPGVMGFYCRACEVLGCLPIFDHSQIGRCHIFVLFSSRGLDHISVCASGTAAARP